MNKLQTNMRRFNTKNLRESIEMDIPSKQGTTRFTVSAQNGNLSIDSITSSDAKIKSGGYLVDDKVYSMSIIPGKPASLQKERPVRILDIKQQGGTIQLNVNILGERTMVNIPSKIFESILVRAENNVDPILDRVPMETFFQDEFEQSSSVATYGMKALNFFSGNQLGHITLKFTKVT